MNSNDLRMIIFWSVIAIVLIGITVGCALGFYEIMKRKPKSYMWLNIPLIIYPYAYMFVLLLSFFVDPEDMYSAFGLPLILAVLFLTIHPMIWGTLIADFRAVRKGYILSKTLYKASVITKCVQIPAYIIHFIYGMFGALASIWGIGFVGFAIVIDLITISFTGTFTVANSIGLYKRNIVTKPVAVVASLLSYIYCIDIADVIVLCILSRKKIKKLS